MSEFAEYVRGRTVAVVGRAAPLPGQGAQIDAHDIVYRTANTPTGGDWGERFDVAFFPWATARDLYLRRSQRLLERLKPVPWWVYKGRPDRGRDGGSERVARWPNIKNPNAVTLMLYDLIRYHEPASVTVYATDLYAAGPGRAYSPETDTRDLAGTAKGVIVHRPHEQRKVHKAVVKTGKIVGDGRYLEAVAMSDADYQAVIDRWDAVYRSTPVNV